MNSDIVGGAVPGVFRRRNRSDAPIGAVCDLAAIDDPRDRSNPTTKSLAVAESGGWTQADSAHASAEAGRYNPRMAILGASGLRVLLPAAAGTLLYCLLVALSGLSHEGVAAVQGVNKNAASLHSGQVRVRNGCVRRCGRLNRTELVCR